VSPSPVVVFKRGEKKGTDLRWIFVPDVAIALWLADGNTTAFGSNDPVVIASRLAREHSAGQDCVKAGYSEYGVSRQKEG
jgi:hypothetical protein